MISYVALVGDAWEFREQGIVIAIVSFLTPIDALNISLVLQIRTRTILSNSRFGDQGILVCCTTYPVGTDPVSTAVLIFLSVNVSLSFCSAH